MGWGGWTAAQAFMLFHDLMLLYPGGYAVFFGKTSMAEPYFSALGFDHPKVRLRPPGQPRSAAGKERAHWRWFLCSLPDLQAGTRPLRFLYPQAHHHQLTNVVRFLYPNKRC